MAIDELVAVDHHGRPAWQASLRPTGGYLPRCGCCALLLSAISDGRQAPGSRAADSDPGLRYPEAHRVRLDVGTGTCVLIEQLGGSRAGTRAEFTIEAVDGAMDDALFATPPGDRRR